MNQTILRIYKLTNLSAPKNTVANEFFASKSSAKKRREALNAEHATPNYIVSLGPDHKNYCGKPRGTL